MPIVLIQVLAGGLMEAQQPAVSQPLDGRVVPLMQTPGASNLTVETVPLSVRVKDITKIGGLRTHRLSSYGLVIGLGQTGSDDDITKQFLLRLLQNKTNGLPRATLENYQTLLRTKNLAVVEVTAELPAFAYPGQEVNVDVSIIDSSTSLRGGRLIQTPLRGLDGEIYAMASGKVFIGGFSAEGQAARIQQNNVTNGSISRGGVIERTLLQENLGAEGYVNFHLMNEDRRTIVRLVEAINSQFSQRIAEVVNQRTVRVAVPMGRTQTEMEKFLAVIQDIRVVPDTTAKVIVNEHNGTIVITENAMLKPVAVTVGNLTISTTESPQVSQPQPLAGGETTVVPRTDITVSEDQNTLRLLNQSKSLRELVDGLNSLGLSAREMLSILEAVKQSGSLQAELIFK
ncbi:flagellar basal body P-ring protein FlgI [Mariniblastus sp.]|nr:flagellar basal body P-ring protein FlgI [Mariniblastus sp.]MDB4756299.1 flagellar basal body P-ring protein FlgI [Mariniblastus sp.]